MDRIPGKHAAQTAAPNSVHRLLDDLAQPGFFGSVIVRFQDGRVVHVIEERSYRPESLSPDNPEDNHAQHQS